MLSPSYPSYFLCGKRRSAIPSSFGFQYKLPPSAPYSAVIKYSKGKPGASEFLQATTLLFRDKARELTSLIDLWQGYQTVARLVIPVKLSKDAFCILSNGTYAPDIGSSVARVDYQYSNRKKLDRVYYFLGYTEAQSASLFLGKLVIYCEI
ncbi:predicted protein [Aspergillus terreus NIH2624]|uniref:Uncharacterized protein n=1 Tax=Aspergillus terreus (strain NIH 2624 / FGSC A1156) TaxID=341663 RepID=Q0C8N3_ASPTN|nr:uncharacterized protein ATEG_09951 [Aspergillus terreus NIH2624]EAU30142.1 predicted protein [Aspergillus terreus NIH2624]